MITGSDIPTTAQKRAKRLTKRAGMSNRGRLGAILGADNRALIQANLQLWARVPVTAKGFEDLK